MKLPDNTILQVEVGSTAYGTGLEGREDHDETVVVIEDPIQVLGLGQGLKNRMDRTQPNGIKSGPGDTDRNIYSLRNFLKLAAQGNPSILTAFWSPVISSTPDGDSLRSLGTQLIGRHVIDRYQGYMTAQALRLLGLRGGDHGKRRQELIDAHGYDTKYAMHTARLGMQCVELLNHRMLLMPMVGEKAEWLRSLRKGEISFDKWWHVVLYYHGLLERMKEDTRIPEGPNKKYIEEWSVFTHLEYWEK